MEGQCQYMNNEAFFCNRVGFENMIVFFSLNNTENFTFTPWMNTELNMNTTNTDNELLFHVLLSLILTLCIITCVLCVEFFNPTRRPRFVQGRIRHF